MFELNAFTAAKLLDHETLSDKDREPDANPGVALSFEMTVGNDFLSMFDGSLRSTLYSRSAASSAPAQGSLDGIPIGMTDMPNLTEIGKHVKRLPWHQEFTGLSLSIDYGLGITGSNLDFADAKAFKFSFQPKEGGSVLVKFKVEAPDVAEVTHGKLPKLKSQEVKILVRAPDPAQQDLDDEPRSSTRSDDAGDDEGNDANSNPLPFDLDPKDKQAENPFQPLTPAQALANSVGIGDEVAPTTQVTVKRGRRAGPATGATLQ